MKNPVPEPCRIIEIDDAGWEAFKQLEAKERREYSLSGEARKDHEEWVNAPMAEDDQWGSFKDGAWVEPRIIANPHQPAWEQLYDWSRESPKNDEAAES